VFPSPDFLIINANKQLSKLGNEGQSGTCWDYFILVFIKKPGIKNCEDLKFETMALRSLD